jgi:hypothetical protein
MPTPSLIEIADAIVARLKAAPAIARGSIHHIVPPPSEIEGVTVTIPAALPDRAALKGHPVQWGTTVTLDLAARYGVGSERPHEPITQLAADVFARLFDDETLGGRAGAILPGLVTFDYSDPDKQRAFAKLQLTVLHDTDHGAM